MVERCGPDCGGNFACSDGRCIKAKRMCDGKKDCEDDSDEDKGRVFRVMNERSCVQETYRVTIQV